MRSTSLLPTPLASQNSTSIKGKTSGIVEKKIDSETYSIKTPSGPLILKLNSSELTPGDRISISFSNNSVHLEKSGLLIKNVELRSPDAFSKGSLSNYKLTDLLETLYTSLQSDTDQNITQNAKTVLTYLQENKTETLLTDKSQLRLFISETEKLLSQKNSLPKETISTLQKIVDNLKTASQSISEKNVPATFVLPASSNIKEGVYSVTSLADAIKLLDIREDNKDAINQLAIALKTSSKILLRVLGDETTGYVVSSLPPESSAQEISSFLRTLKSPLLQSLPQESIEIVLNVKGSITFDSLKNIDGLLKGSTIQFPGERGGSRSAAITAAANWFYTTLDTERSTKIPVNLTPVIPAQKLIHDIENINDLLNKYPQNTFSSLIQPGITEAQLQSNDKHSIIPHTIQKLGYDLESNFLNDKESSSPSLKKELLRLQDHLQTDSESYSHIESAKENQTERKPLSVLLNEKLAIPIKKLIDDQTEFAKQFTFQKQFSEQVSNGSHSEDSTISESTSKEIKKVFANSINTLQTIQNLIRNTSETDTLTKDQIGKIDTLIQMLRKTNNASESFFIDLQKHFSELINNLSSRTGADSIETNLAKVHSDVTQLTAEKTPASQYEYLSSIQSTLRQTIESSLGRLESLQLLARQIPVADGQQQMLALPMRIGDEWTEVNISFLKRKNSSKKKNPQVSTFSVSLNLAPKHLGPIAVKMEYVQKKSLKIAMNFELESTKNYFQKFSEEIKNALRSYGLPLFSIDITRKKDKSDQKKTTPLDTLIDMKV
jgi:hypothetical protein